MATADEIRRRLAELNRDTAARLGPNPATESMRTRMAASDRVMARDFNAQQASAAGQADVNRNIDRMRRARTGAATAPAGTTFTQPGVQTVDRTTAQAPRTPGRLGNVLGRTVNTPTTRALGTVGRGIGRVAGAVGRGLRGPLSLGITAASLGTAASNTETGERVRQPVTDFLARATGLDSLQNRLLSEDPEVASVAQQEFAASRPAAPPVAAPSVVATVPAGGAAPANDGLAPNTVRRADGTVTAVNPEAQVNTIASEDFVRPSTGLSQRLGDARLAAARRGDFGQLEEDRAAFATQLAGIRDTLRQEDIDNTLEDLQAFSGSPSRRRELQERLAQLNLGADRDANVQIAGINADARRIPAQDPMMNPQVIAERLRQQGANQRAAMQPDDDLLRGLEPIEDLQGGVSGFQGTDSRGVPIVIPQSELALYSGQFQRLRQDGIIPATETFADFVSRIQAEAGQG